MPNPPKYTVSHDEKRSDWALSEDGSGKVKSRFENKAEALTGGALRKAVGPTGGSLKIQK